MTPAPPSTTRDPSARGPHPVGVRTVTVASQGRSLDVEVWYPAAPRHQGQDLDPGDLFSMMPGMPSWRQLAARDADPSPAPCPLVVFSHGYSSHRRQSTFLCTHLASHGFAVAAPDHAGNTVLDVLMEQAEGGTAEQARARAVDGVIRTLGLRPGDLRAVLDALLGGLPGLPAADPERVGACGHSMGGWTALCLPAIDDRVRAVVALSPAGGATPTYPDKNPVRDALRLDWKRPCPTLVLAAERDTILPLDGMRELTSRIAAPTRLEVLGNAEHLHFIDNAALLHDLFRAMPGHPLYGDRGAAMPPFADMTDEETAHRFARGLSLEHLRAHL